MSNGYSMNYDTGASEGNGVNESSSSSSSSSSGGGGKTPVQKFNEWVYKNCSNKWEDAIKNGYTGSFNYRGKEAYYNPETKQLELTQNSQNKTSGGEGLHIDFSGKSALVSGFFRPKNDLQFGEDPNDPWILSFAGGKGNELYEVWNATEIATYFNFQARNIDTGGNFSIGVAYVMFTNGIITFQKEYTISSNESWGFGGTLGVSFTTANYTASLPIGSKPEDVIASFKGYFDSLGGSIPMLPFLGVEVSYTQGADGVWSGWTYGLSLSPGGFIGETRTWYEPSKKSYKSLGYF